MSGKYCVNCIYIDDTICVHIDDAIYVKRYIKMCVALGNLGTVLK